MPHSGVVSHKLIEDKSKLCHDKKITGKTINLLKRISDKKKVLLLKKISKTGQTLTNMQSVLVLNAK